MENSLQPVIFATKVRIYPYNQYERTVCLRVEVVGCPTDGEYWDLWPLVSGTERDTSNLQSEVDDEWLPINQRRRMRLLRLLTADGECIPNYLTLCPPASP